MAELRAEWLAQLAESIEGAQRVAWQLGMREGASSEARELYGRLEAARLELDCLRKSTALPLQTTDRDWLEKLGWSSSLLDPRD